MRQGVAICALLPWSSSAAQHRSAENRHQEHTHLRINHVVKAAG